MTFLMWMQQAILPRFTILWGGHVFMLFVFPCFGFVSKNHESRLIMFLVLRVEWIKQGRSKETSEGYSRSWHTYEVSGYDFIWKFWLIFLFVFVASSMSSLPPGEIWPFEVESKIASYWLRSENGFHYMVKTSSHRGDQSQDSHFVPCSNSVPWQSYFHGKKLHGEACSGELALYQGGMWKRSKVDKHP